MNLPSLPRRRRHVAVLLLLVLLAGACGGGDGNGNGDARGVTTTDPGNGGSTTQVRRNRVGQVLAVVARRARVNGDEVTSARGLAPGDVLETDARGELTFSLDEKIENATALTETRVRVHPSGDVLFELLAGTAVVQTSTDQRAAVLQAGDVRLRAVDPLFVLTYTKDRQVMVKVDTGFVEVARPGASGAPALVGPQEQRTVAASGPPRAVQTMRLTNPQQRVVQALRPRVTPEFRRPEAGPSRQLQTVFRRQRLSVAVVTDAPQADSAVSFAKAYFGFLSEKWGLAPPELRTVGSKDAPALLADRGVDVVVAPPGQAGAPRGTALPLFEHPDGRVWQQLVADDSGYVAALRSFLVNALNGGNYAEVYRATFAAGPRYGPFRALVVG